MVAKRLLDFFASLIALILLFPFFIILGLLIIADSRGGIFYQQNRVGKGFKDFNLVKFRTMYKDSASKGLLTVGARDSRITRIGYFLRKLKLDELPQLFNVFLGHMSIVGPRPEVRKYAELYSEEHRRIFTVRPGLTGYASLLYINEDELLAKADDPEKFYIEQIMPEKNKINLKYIDNRTFWSDIRLIFLTIGRIFTKF